MTEAPVLEPGVAMEVPCREYTPEVSPEDYDRRDTAVRVVMVYHYLFLIPGKQQFEFWLNRLPDGRFQWIPWKLSAAESDGGYVADFGPSHPGEPAPSVPHTGMTTYDHGQW
jgi:hypothetical protein